MLRQNDEVFIIIERIKTKKYFIKYELFYFYRLFYLYMFIDFIYYF